MYLWITYEFAKNQVVKQVKYFIYISVLYIIVYYDFEHSMFKKINA